MISGIGDAIAGVFKIAWSWMTGYGGKKQIEARRIQDEQDKKNQLERDIANHDIDAIRRKLND